MKKFSGDNAVDHIIAFDFDGCITQGNKFPNCGAPRIYAREVINLLHDLGVRVIIWTCRDRSIGGVNECGYDDIIPIVEWLHKHDIRYDAINSSIDYAPWHYEARKVYAHMYVDDQGFGWEDTDEIMLDVLRSFMVSIMGISLSTACDVRHDIMLGRKINVELLKDVTRYRHHRNRGMV